MKSSSVLSSVSKGSKVRVVAIDPGVTTGVCVLEGTIGVRFSDGWRMMLQQWTLEELYSRGSGTFGGGLLPAGNMSSETMLPAGNKVDWWSFVSVSGLQLAWMMVDTFGDTGVDCWIMEDYILRPSGVGGGSGVGIGGRNAVVPVAFGAAYRSQLLGLEVGGAWLISSPSAKAVMSDSRLDRWFGKGEFRGKPHARDACRHALLSVRRKDEW